MKRTFVMGLSVFFLCAGVSGCGANRSLPAEETGGDTEVRGVAFSEFESNYNDLVKRYDSVKNTYEMSYVAADKDVEEALRKAADVLNDIGEPKEEDFTSQAVLNSKNQNILDAFAVLDAAGEKIHSSAGMMTFEQVKENYDKMLEAYEKVLAVNADTQDPYLKSALNDAKSIKERFGTLKEESFKSQNEMLQFNMVVEETLKKLNAALS